MHQLGDTHFPRAVHNCQNSQPRIKSARRFVLFITIVCGFAPNACTVTFALSFQPIAIENDRAPGVIGEPGARFASFNTPVINNAGDVAFFADLSFFSINGIDSEGVWSGNPQDLESAAFEGTSLPGSNRELIFLSPDVSINSAGQVLIDATVSDPNFNFDNVILVGRPDNLQTVARTGLTTAGSHTLDFYISTTVNLSDNGAVTLQGEADNGKDAIWHISSMGTEVLAMEESQVPIDSGFPAGTTFGRHSILQEAVINSDGHFAFYAPVILPNASTSTKAIWYKTPSSFDLAVHEGGSAPGMPGVSFQELSLAANVNLNNSGQIAFTATLSDETSSGSIWIGTPDNLTLVMKDGDAVIPQAPNVVVDRLFDQSWLPFSDSGDALVVAELAGAGVTSDNSRAILATSKSGTRLVARAGDQAIGTEPGTTWGHFNAPSINSNGHAMFHATLTGEGINAGNRSGIWAENSNGELKLVARNGDWLNPVTGEVVRYADVNDREQLESQGYSEINSLLTNTLFVQEGAASDWNDAGQLALEAILDDPETGNALIIANLNEQRTGDLDLDGDTDGSDFLEWQRSDRTADTLTDWTSNYGQASISSTSIPEPNTAILLIMCGMGYASCVTGRRKCL